MEQFILLFVPFALILSYPAMLFYHHVYCVNSLIAVSVQGNLLFVASKYCCSLLIQYFVFLTIYMQSYWRQSGLSQQGTAALGLHCVRHHHFTVIPVQGMENLWEEFFCYRQMFVTSAIGKCLSPFICKYQGKELSRYMNTCVQACFLSPLIICAWLMTMYFLCNSGIPCWTVSQTLAPKQFSAQMGLLLAPSQGRTQFRLPASTNKTWIHQTALGRRAPLGTFPFVAIFHFDADCEI